MKAAIGGTCVRKLIVGVWIFMADNAEVCRMEIGPPVPEVHTIKAFFKLLLSSLGYKF
jgi:hypothetical protein